MTGDKFAIQGRIMDVVNRRDFTGTIHIENGHISELQEHPVERGPLILPGLIDAHIHIESSMLVPSEFARLASAHGTIATVSDPHEIANVLGMEGVQFMLDNAATTPFKFHFGAPSCVPATPFETAGDNITLKDIETLLQREDIVSLSEMMNVPGVLNDDSEVLQKLEISRKYGKVVDGHAPGLMGEEISKYVGAGITTDHESMTLEEARQKLALGMQVQIREGSAARNLADLFPLLHHDFENCMLCSDDKHPDDLMEGHIDAMVRYAIQQGVDPFNVLWSACVTPVKTYGLKVGLLQEGDPADLILVDGLDSFKVLETYVQGQLVARDGVTLLKPTPVTPVNKFVARPLTSGDIEMQSDLESVPVIRVVPGQLVTQREDVVPRRDPQGLIRSDPEADLLKLVVLNRYEQRPPGLGLIKGFGIGRAALASSVAHDSHNIVAVGGDDQSLLRAIALVIENKGGISAVSGHQEVVLPLPVAGLMSANDGNEVGQAYADLDALARSMGSELDAPFMTLSFMALLVIPEIKLSDRGLFDGNSFQFIEAFQSQNDQ